MNKQLNPWLVIAVLAVMVGMVTATNIVKSSTAASEGKYSYCEYLFNTDDWTVVRCKR